MSAAWISGAKVIDPALLEVNGLSDMGVNIELRRRHARTSIHEVAISWWRKSGEEYRAALQERNRSKVGRMARLRGQVETMESGKQTTENDDTEQRIDAVA
jgi:hypothetical protein